MRSNKNKSFFYKKGLRSNKKPVTLDGESIVEQHTPLVSTTDIPSLPNASLNRVYSKNELDSLIYETRHALTESQNQKDILEKKLDQQPAILLGGFFKIHPTDQTGLTTSNSTYELKNALKKTEQDLFQLTATLKVAEALEKTQQAEAARRFEENLRKLYEEKAKQALEYADETLSKMRKSIHQLELAETAKKAAEANQHMLKEQYEHALQQIQNFEQSWLQEISQKKELEQKLTELEDRNSQNCSKFNQKITTLQQSLKISDTMYQQEKIQKQAIAEKLEKFTEQLVRLENVIQQERILRKLLEQSTAFSEKNRETVDNINS